MPSKTVNIPQWAVLPRAQKPAPRYTSTNADKEKGVPTKKPKGVTAVSTSQQGIMPRTGASTYTGSGVSAAQQGTTPPSPPPPVPPPTSGQPQSLVASGIQSGQGIGAQSVNPAYSPVSTGLTNTGPNSGGLTEPLSGFASAFRPGYLPDLYQAPELILAQLMSQGGLDPTGAASGLMAQMTPYMDTLTALAPLAWGGNLPGGESDPINWIAKMAQQGMTPGGAGVNFRDVMNMIQGLGGSQMGDYINGQTPGDQIALLRGLVGAGTQGLHPMFGRAVQNQMNQSALQYMLGQATNGAPSNFLQSGQFPNFFGPR